MAMGLVVEVVRAWGHPNVKAEHPTTFEVTRERWLTSKGDCIIAVGADKAARDLGREFKEAARRPGAEITIVIEVPSHGVEEVVRAEGHPALTFEHPTDMVVRKSYFVCGRTVAVGADKAARDLSRELVRALRERGTRVIIRLEVL